MDYEEAIFFGIDGPIDEAHDERNSKGCGCLLLIIVLALALFGLAYQ